MMLEKELRAPDAPRSVHHPIAKVIRSIPKGVKHEVYTGCCSNCGVMSNLEYDHTENIFNFSN